MFDKMMKSVAVLIIAAFRCGADPQLKNKDGLTPEDVLIREQCPGWESNLYWLQTYSPGEVDTFRPY